VKAGTPPERVKVLSDALQKVAASAEYRKFLQEQYAAEDSFVPASGAAAYLDRQLADMKNAMVKKS